jgi:hypothetical protein
MSPQVALVFTFLAAPITAFAQPSPLDVPSDEPPAEGSDAAGGGSIRDRLTLDLSLTYTSDYFFRGIVQRSDAFNIQPAAQLSFQMFEEEDLTLSIIGGSWSNFSDDLAPGHSGSFTEHWYEHDAYAGLSLSASRFTLDAAYTWYFSPASDFTEVEDITLSLSYDDAGQWDDEGRFSLNPSASVAFETRNAASGPDSGVWLGLGLEPTVGLGESFLGPTTLSFPVGVGLSLDDYYQRADGTSDTFGYAEVGANLSFDMAKRFGDAAPTLDAGASYLMLGGVLDDLNDGDSDEVVVTIGLSWSF